MTMYDSLRLTRRREAYCLPTWCILVTISLAVILSGCVASKQPLFDRSKSVIPVADGMFLVEKLNEHGHWVKDTTIKLTHDGRVYKIHSDKDRAFTLHEIGKDLYVGVWMGDFNASVHNKMFIYALIQKQNESYLYYQPTCDDFQYLRLPNSLRPLIDGGLCVYDNRTKLVQALRLYARISNPDKRYTRLKP